MEMKIEPKIVGWKLNDIGYGTAFKCQASGNWVDRVATVEWKSSAQKGGDWMAIKKSNDNRSLIDENMKK